MSWGYGQGHQQQQNYQYGGYGGGYGAPGGHYPHNPSAPPSCPPGVDPTAFQWFLSVDQDGSGRITAAELRRALMNNKMKLFNPETCRLMIGMFDKDRDGKIDLHEFSGLWSYIQQWRQCFDSFDTDRSGNIDAGELSRAFTTFGYRLSMQFSQQIVRVFDRSSLNTIDFDDFIQVCVMLQTLTDKFRAKDTNRSGTIQLRYEEFLEMALDQV